MTGLTMTGDKTRFDLQALRPAAPVLFYPLGILYCMAYDFTVTGSLLPWREVVDWGVAALTPWVAAAIIFERSMQPGDTRQRVVVRAAVLAMAAFVLGGLAGLALGIGPEFSFLRRIPLVATALLVAAIYPLTPLPVRVARAEDPDAEALPVCAEEVRYASGAGNYVELHCEGRVALWRQTMREAETTLRPAGFVRVHRSYLVRRQAIAQIHQTRKGPVEVVLDDGECLPVSASYAAALLHGTDNRHAA